MIYIDEHRHAIQGIPPLLLAEYRMITKLLAKHIPKEVLHDAFDMAFMTDEEIDKKFEELVKDEDELKKEIKDLLKDASAQDVFNALFGDLFDE